TAEDLEKYRGVKGIDWQDMLFRTGATNIHNLSLRGGSTQTKYMLSGSIFEQEGTIVNSGFQRYQGRFSVDQTINNKLSTGININFNRGNSHGIVANEAGHTTG